MIYMGMVNGLFLCLGTFSSGQIFLNLQTKVVGVKKAPVTGISGEITSSSHALKGKRDVLTKQSGILTQL
jgi:hypothetical protein